MMHHILLALCSLCSLCILESDALSTLRTCCPNSAGIANTFNTSHSDGRVVSLGQVTREEWKDDSHEQNSEALPLHSRRAVQRCIKNYIFNGFERYKGHLTGAFAHLAA